MRLRFNVYKVLAIAESTRHSWVPGQAHAAQSGHNVLSRPAQARVVIPRPLNQNFHGLKGNAVEPRAQRFARVSRTKNVLNGHIVEWNVSVHHKPEHHRIAVFHQFPRLHVREFELAQVCTKHGICDSASVHVYKKSVVCRLWSHSHSSDDNDTVFVS